MDVYKFYNAISIFRRRRMARFVKALSVTPEHTVLDVGGTPEIWAHSPVKPKVTFLNRYMLPDVASDRQIVADGCNIPVPNQTYDFAFSNSVIEHVGSMERQAAFARELRRVGRTVWVQTPDRAFPLEMHTLAPFIHWLPENKFRKLAPFMSPRRPFEDSATFGTNLEELHLLGKRQMAELFPGGKMIRERIFGIPKSIIVICPSD